jgi:hypothetical protein
MSVITIFGDLVESSIKRQAQRKDCGSLLLGRGGILDRFDSSLFAVLLYSFLMVRVKCDLEFKSMLQQYQEIDMLQNDQEMDMTLKDIKIAKMRLAK